MMKDLPTLKNLGICLVCAMVAGCAYLTQGVNPPDDRGAWLPKTADIYGDIAKEIVYPKQNWDPADSLWFYNTSQGSNLMDYQIFKHLEQVDSPNAEGKFLLFRDNDNMNEFRFLPQKVTKGNPDWLPVGWVKDSYEGNDYIGLTCAACHTTQVNYNNEQKGISVGIRIDGGPSMADIQTMFKELENALMASKYEEKDHDKFDRLAKKVLGPDASATEISAFAGKVEAQHKKIKLLNDKNDPKVDPTLVQKDRDWNGQPHKRKNGHYGYGRLDAFGRIFNRIESIRAPSSKGKYKPANAPVSYPFLWDTPHHDFVQWNGIAGNTGAGGLGPMGRNVSEVIGVFATVHAGREEPGIFKTGIGFGNYRSSLRKWNQVGLELKIKQLWSPSWIQLAEINVLPPILGLPIEEEEREKFMEEKSNEIEKTSDAELSDKIEEMKKGPPDWEFGLAVFKKYKCALCHESIDRTDSGRRVISKFSSVDIIEEDPMEGKEYKIGTDPMMAANAIHYCGRNEFPDIPKKKRCRFIDPRDDTKDDPEDEPKGFKGAKGIGQMVGNVLGNGALWDFPVFLVSWATNPWKSWIPFMTSEADLHIDFEVWDDKTVEKKQGDHLKVYKGRPLNGIWATAPYLHNGSVPNLYELFLPSSCKDKHGRQLEEGKTCRSKTFTVGNRELDTEKVGFKQLDKNQFSDEEV
ncbi:MAG: di-heme-cytochrome C peroxidase, partial [Nitrospirales bacterium]